MPLVKPAGYRNLLDNVENTEKAIKLVKDMFQQNLVGSARAAARDRPDGRAFRHGYQRRSEQRRAARFVPYPRHGRAPAEVVHSLAKWKRLKLAEMAVAPGRGIYTDMNALRPDEELDNIHSLYVDQWDWEKVITREQRTVSFLKQTVRRIYEAIKVTENRLYVEFPQIVPMLPEEIRFIHAQRLLDLYPDKTPKERENEIVRRYGAVFVMGIGAPLSDGRPHDGRAADYDDWSTPGEDGYPGLNGDILLWNPLLGKRFRGVEHGNPGRRAFARPPVGSARGARQREPLFSPEVACRRAALHDRRRYRAVAAVHVPASQGPYRRDSEQYLARVDAPRVLGSRHRAGLTRDRVPGGHFRCAGPGLADADTAAGPCFGLPLFVPDSILRMRNGPVRTVGKFPNPASDIFGSPIGFDVAVHIE